MSNSTGSPVVFFPTSPLGVVVSLTATIAAVVISAWRIRGHLSTFTVPRLQIPIVRILFIVPFYATFSWLSLTFENGAPYFEAVRDVYEAFVIYSFLSLILEFCGGENACVVHLMTDPGSVSHVWPLNRLFDDVPLNNVFMRRCKQATLQFVLVKPVMGIAAIGMSASNKAHETTWVVTELLIYNVSYTVALYGLLMFYLATKAHPGMKSRRPVYKFASVKLVVFATYYQSLFFRAIPSLTNEQISAVNAFVLCMEMPVFAVLHAFAFPASEYENQEGIGATAAGISSDDGDYTAPSTAQAAESVGGGAAVRDPTRQVVDASDVASDAFYSFNPKYRTHVRLGEDDTGFRDADSAAGASDGDDEDKPTEEDGGNPFALT